MRVRFTVEVVVHDPELLKAYTKDLWAKALGAPGDPDDLPIEEYVLEALVLSNANPSPDEYGIEIDDATTMMVEEA